MDWSTVTAGTSRPKSDTTTKGVAIRPEEMTATSTARRFVWATTTRSRTSPSAPVSVSTTSPPRSTTIGSMATRDLSFATAEDESSLQSSLGALATMAISTQFGVLLPQVSASWVHDYDVGGRNIDASFVVDPTDSKFKFKREPVAENFANIGVGIS